MQIGGKAVAVYDYKITMRRTAGSGQGRGARGAPTASEEEEADGQDEDGLGEEG